MGPTPPLPAAQDSRVRPASVDTTRRRKDRDSAPIATIYGGGVSGLTVAQELVERGFVVQVVEKALHLDEEGRCDVGGMARSQWGRVPLAVLDLHPHLRSASATRGERALGAVLQCLRGNLTPTTRPCHVPFTVRCRCPEERDDKGHLDGWSDHIPAGRAGSDGPAPWTGPAFEAAADWRKGPWVADDLWKLRVVADNLADSLREYRAHFLAQLLRLHEMGLLRAERAVIQLTEADCALLESMRRNQVDGEGGEPWSAVTIVGLLGLDADRGPPEALGSEGLPQGLTEDFARGAMETSRVAFASDPGLMGLIQAMAPNKVISSADRVTFDYDFDSLVGADGAKVAAGHRKRLASLASMIDRDILWVCVRGYTDTDLTPPQSRRVSLQQARATVAALKALRPELAPHLDARGLGSEFPVAPSLRAEDRRANNRVDFYVFEHRLPGEHGYRFFPAHYRHLRDTLQRIPIYDDQGLETLDTVHDNLLPTTRQGVAMVDGLEPAEVIRGKPNSYAEFRRLFKRWRRLLGITDEDLIKFEYSLFKYLTTCSERREHKLEKVSWWQFINGEDLSDGMQRQVHALAQALVAFNPKEADARTYGNIALQLMADQFGDSEFVDMTLNGPTSQVWLRPWKQYLERQGVRFFVGRVRGLMAGTAGQGEIQAIVTPCGRSAQGRRHTYHREARKLLCAPRGKDTDKVATSLAEVVVEALDGGAGQHDQLIPARPDPEGSYVWLDESAKHEASHPDFHVLALPLPQVRELLAQLTRDPSAMGLRVILEDEGYSLPPLGPEATVLAPFRLGGDLGRFWNWTSQEDVDWKPPMGQREPGEDWHHIPMRHMVGIQYYFQTNFTIGDGHTYYPESEWALSSISQPTFWRFRPTSSAGYLGLLSVDICDWNNPYEGLKPELVDRGVDLLGSQDLLDQSAYARSRDLPQDIAWGCSAQQIAHISWNQVLEGLGHRSALEASLPAYYHLDRNIQLDSDGCPVANTTAFLASTVGLWQGRPGRQTVRSARRGGKVGLVRYEVSHLRWVMAGTHMVTHTRMTTMEAANESARHAVKAILHQLLPTVEDRQHGLAPKLPVVPLYNAQGRRMGADPDTWNVEEEEFPDLAFLKDLDRRLYHRDVKERSLLELLGGDAWLQQAVQGLSLADRGLELTTELVKHLDKVDAILEDLELEHLNEFRRASKHQAEDYLSQSDDDPTSRLERIERRIAELLSSDRVERDADYAADLLGFLLGRSGKTPRRKRRTQD